MTMRSATAANVKIYWLVDVRPETLLTHPLGKPFYCGLAIGRSLARRLSAHRSESKWEDSGIKGGRHVRKVAFWFAQRDPHVQIQEMENLNHWCGDMVGINERFWFWISSLRLLWPDNANENDNGKPKAPPKRRRRKKIKKEKYGPNVSEADQIEIDRWTKQFRAERAAGKSERQRLQREAKALREANRAARIANKRAKERDRAEAQRVREAAFRAKSIRLSEARKAAKRALRLPPLPY
jgi:hypothetical protein